MSITPSAKRSRAAAEEAGITSSLLEMALQLGEVEHSGARQLITEGLGSSGPAYQGEGYTIARDPYVNSMVQLFPGDEEAHDPHKVNLPWGNAGENATLEGDETLKFLDKFNYGEYLKTAFKVKDAPRENMENQWWYQLLSGTITQEKRKLMMGLMGYGMTAAGLSSFFSLLGEPSPEQINRLSELECWMKDNCDFSAMDEEYYSSLVKRMKEIIPPESADDFSPGEYQSIIPTLAQGAKIDQDAIERGDYYGVLLDLVKGYLSREMLEVVSNHLMECQVYLDNITASAITLGEITIPLSPMRKMLERLSESIMDSPRRPRYVDINQWPGDILLAFSTLGSRLNFFTLAYYSELQDQYNNEWALAACDWNSMGNHEEDLERAQGKQMQQSSGESSPQGQGRMLSTLSHIVYGENTKSTELGR